MRATAMARRRPGDVDAPVRIRQRRREQGGERDEGQRDLGVVGGFSLGSYPVSGMDE